MSSVRIKNHGAARHDVFLSHSGAQKGFAMDLYQKLDSYGFPTFLDVKYHSLPLAESFPRRIFTAASTCKLALVVFSREYVSSKWPMLELCAFVRAAPSVKILPLFLHLSPSDLKEESNLTKWLEEWERFAELDSRIDVSEWKTALHVVCSRNGVTYLGAAQEGEQAFIGRTVDSICTSQTLEPRNMYDTSYMQGKARLQQIILDKFEQMESQHRQAVSQCASTSSSSSTQIRMACVLGVHGFPGSGKSTLCRSLRDYLFPHYPGKIFYLEFPTDPTLVDVINTIRDGLNLTPLHRATHIDEMGSVLRNGGLSSDSIFLMVDNICTNKSYIEVVRRILPHIVGPGSRVLLVARTFDALSPMLRMLVRLLKMNCVCDTMPMPGINEFEATNILLQTTAQASVGADDENSTLRQAVQLRRYDRQQVLHVVRMCGFGPKGDLYLPMVMQQMGVMLTCYEKDMDGWTRDQEKFWRSFHDKDLETYREVVVRELILESFTKLLDGQLQLLFLDVALFLQPSRICAILFREACYILGSMHGQDVATTKKMVRDLKRLCFIHSLSGIFVHDVYVDFAKSIQHSGFTHWSYIISRPTGTSTIQLKLQEDQKITERPARAMILEVAEGCKVIDLRNFPGLKAVFVRNCKALLTFRMTGLTSLASLDIRGFGQLPRLECNDRNPLYASLQNVKRLSLVSDTVNVSNAAGKYVWEQPFLAVPALMRKLGSSVIDLIHMRVSNYVPSFIMQHPSRMQGIAERMKQLQVLHLEDTGIRTLEDMSSCWPNLQELHVRECFLEGFRLGTLPNLKILFLLDICRHYQQQQAWEEKRGNRKYMLQGKDLLKGCPALQKVHINSAFFENVELMNPTGSGLRKLRLHFCLNTCTELPNLVSSSAHSLEHLTLRHCVKLERLDLSAGFQNLKHLSIRSCHGVVEINLGRQVLPSLVELNILKCSELCVLSGLEDLRLLEKVFVGRLCPKLQFKSNWHSFLSGLTSLKDLHLMLYRAPDAETKLQRLLADLEIAGSDNQLASMNSSEELDADNHIFSALIPIHKLGELTSLEELRLTSLMVGFEQPSNTDHYMDCNSTSRCMQKFDCRRLSKLETLSLPYVSFPQLTKLGLSDLKYLSCVHGIDGLIHLEQLSIEGCPLLEELPSLHTLQQLQSIEIVECVKLKAVQGCDEMRGLVEVDFCGCESMEQPPLKDRYVVHVRDISFEGCRFARDRELMMKWAGVSAVLCKGVLKALVWDYYDASSQADKQGLVETILLCLLMFHRSSSERLHRLLDIERVLEIFPVDNYIALISRKSRGISECMPQFLVAVRHRRGFCNLELDKFIEAVDLNRTKWRKLCELNMDRLHLILELLRPFHSLVYRKDYLVLSDDSSGSSSDIYEGYGCYI